MSVLNLGQSAGYGTIDTEDALLAPLFTIAAAASTGVAQVDIMGYSLSDVATQVSGYSITWAFVLAVVTLALAWISNDPDLSKMDKEYTYLTAGTGVLLVGIEFSDTVASTVTGSDPIALVAMAAMAGGFYAVSYLG